MRWSEAGYLSRIVLAHTPRQASVSLILDVRQSRTMWTPYQQRNKRLPDFKVRYRFIPHAEGGRVQAPYQGYRSDLHYEGEDMQADGIYMVWPEFLNPDGSVVMEDEMLVAPEGDAYMWILMHKEMKEHHRKRAAVGRRCWFMEGTRKVAEAYITERIGLDQNT